MSTGEGHSSTLGVKAEHVPNESGNIEVPPELATLSKNNETGTGAEEEKRNLWSDRWAFWLAAVGSAVGLGNLWRFPWQCATWGGGAFILAYLLCLFTLGMPILTQELALGQKHRSGDIEAFGKMNWRLRGIGLASVIGAFGIISYYAVVIGMSVVFLFESMQTNLPYGSDNPGYWQTDVMIICDYPITPECGSRFAWKLYLSTVAVYVFTYLCIWKGVLSASIIVKITMPLPLFFLFILFIHGLFLEGSSNGIKEYWSFDNWRELGNVEMWDAAVGQCFFSLSICMGVMTAYGSYNPITQNIATDEKVVSFLDLSVSLFAGFVVYAVLGHLQYIENNTTVESSVNWYSSNSTTIDWYSINSTTVDWYSNISTTVDWYSTTAEPVDWYSTASFGLVFSAYPIAISKFGDTPIPQLFGVIFFFTLFLLGIDSLFSLVEGLSTVMVDSDFGRQLKLQHMQTAGALCFGGMIFSLIYCFGSGLYMLDIVDRYVNNYGMIFLAICETTALGWFYELERQTNVVGIKTIYIYRLGYFITWALTLFITFLIVESAETEDIVSWVIGILLWSIGVTISYFIAVSYIPEQLQTNLTTFTKVWYVVGWEGPEALRDFMNNNGVDNWDQIKHTKDGELMAMTHHGTIGIWWGFLIKYFIPVILSVVLTATAIHDTQEPYGGYEWGHLTVGILVFSLMVIIVAVIIFAPHLLKRSYDEDNENIEVDEPDEPDEENNYDKIVDNTQGNTQGASTAVEETNQ